MPVSRRGLASMRSTDFARPLSLSSSPLFGGTQQLVVGRRIPQEKAEPARQRVRIEAREARPCRVGFGPVRDEQRLRRQQQPLERDREAAVEIAELFRRLDAARNDRVGRRLV